MEEIKKEVRKLALEELNRSIEQYKHPIFNSLHEGYAVLKEEIEEATEETDRICQKLKLVWHSIKLDQYPGEHIQLIKQYAELLACEAIQVAAMARKFEESFIE
jgi:NAD(P)H-dependent flavin oxidoreductase YrpB (nitropropane dioxygenase family)